MSGGASNQNRTKRLPKDYVPGYAAVLVRAEVKEELARFRARSGLLHESLVERCLVTAAFELLLGDPALHGRWLQQFKQAVNRDVEITIADAGVGAARVGP